MTRLIFLHGLGDDLGAWNAALCERALEPFECVALNLPGHGANGWVGESVEVLARLLWAEVGGPDSVLVGHSLGGVVATLVAAARPGGLKAVINIEGNLTDDDCFLSGRAAAAENFGSWFDAYQKRWPGRYGEALQRCAPEAFQSLSRDLVRLSADDQIGHVYRQIDLPKLYLRGTDGFPAASSSFLGGERVEIFSGAATG